MKRKRKALGRGALLLVTAFTIYLLAPGLVEVLSSWDQVSALEPRWILLVGGCQVLAWSSVWSLQRLVLRTDRWFPVVTSQLAGHAASRVVPGGAATSAAVQFRLLRSAGVPTANASLGLAAASIIQLGIVLALPVAVIPTVVFGAPVEPSLEVAAYLAVVLFAVLVLLAYIGLSFDRPLAWIGHQVDRIQGLIQRNPQVLTDPMRDRLLTERNAMKEELGSQWWRAVLFSTSRACLDYLSLLAAVAAFGSEVRPSLILLAFASASLLATIPLTPGGLGFVEAGLTGMLVLAGVSALDSVSAALLYRLFSFWLPIPVGLLAGAIHGHRYPTKAASSRSR